MPAVAVDVLSTFVTVTCVPNGRVLWAAVSPLHGGSYHVASPVCTPAPADGEQPMTLEQAAAKLEPNYDGRPSKVLFFNADDKTKYGTAMKALDMAHGAGVNTIGLMTDPPLVTAARKSHIIMRPVRTLNRSAPTM